MPIDMSAAVAAPKPPPRKNAATPKTTRTQSSHAPGKGQRELREDGLLGLGQLGQALCLMAQQYADAATVGIHVPGIAHEVAALADEYDIVANTVDLVIKVGPLGGLLAAVLPFGLQLMANHRLIDASRIVGSNIQPPEALEASMKAQVIQMKANAMREQQNAMEAMRRAEEDFARYQTTQESPHTTQEFEPVG